MSDTEKKQPADAGQLERQVRPCELAGLHMGHDKLWWVGQSLALFFSLTLAYKYGGPIGGAVGYAIAVLVDIREAVTRRAVRA